MRGKFKKTAFILFASSISMAAFASSHTAPVNFYQVYKSALRNDQQFKEALANRDITEQDVPQAIAVLLPQINFLGTAGLEKTFINGSNVRAGQARVPGVTNEIFKQRSLGFNVTLTQQIFNFTDWMNLASAKNSVKAAYATFTAAVQSLIQRTAEAYFNVLSANDNLRFSESEKRAFYRQYLQAKESYEVGVKTITDMYNAKASYDTSVAAVIAAENDLDVEKENLSVITGIYYENLVPLVRLPLVKPAPASITAWTNKAEQNSWEIKAGLYSMLAAHDAIKSAFGGHLPTVDFSSSFSNVYTRNFDSGGGQNRQKVLQADLNLDVPIFSGGEVTSQVKQAIAEYDLASSTLEQTHRDVVNQTRTAYLTAISGISQIKADQQAVVSNRSSLEGMEEGYKVGTRTIVDVLTAEKELYDAERQYADDRYNYILSLIDLKQAAGTLNIDDIRKINAWLGPRPKEGVRSVIRKVDGGYIVEPKSVEKTEALRNQEQEQARKTRSYKAEPYERKTYTDVKREQEKSTADKTSQSSKHNDANETTVEQTKSQPQTPNKTVEPTASGSSYEAKSYSDIYHSSKTEEHSAKKEMEKTTPTDKTKAQTLDDNTDKKYNDYYDDTYSSKTHYKNYGRT